ncbi:hypothetical protein ACFYY8_18645 [Streptosporangium sp. NPDC001559]|uniref:hypothetical protein n=1 Tax=Streptosporangium sp. NPDC001559 TaxID=3366187 RepID=UPI0036ED82ED
MHVVAGASECDPSAGFDVAERGQAVLHQHVDQCLHGHVGLVRVAHRSADVEHVVGAPPGRDPPQELSIRERRRV